jgi:uncharacterized phage-associated protein
MAYRSLIAANTVLETGLRRCLQIDHMKLQKLLFFAHGFHLAVLDAPLVAEKFETWPYGPVNPVVYRSFRQFGARIINAYALDYLSGDTEPKAYVINHADVSAYEIIESVLDRFGHLSAITLSNMTHQKGSPWDTARNKKAQQIDDEDIKAYFSNLN